MNTLHHAPHTHARPETRPAEPLLASSLISASDLSSILEGLGSTSITEKDTSGLEILRTGVTSVDDALGHAVQEGRVVAISSETQSTRNDVRFCSLPSHAGGCGSVELGKLIKESR